MTSIIRCITDEVKMTQAREDWAKITGKSTYNKTVYYHNTENGQLYSYIAGAVGWPGKVAQGYVCVIAVDKIGTDVEPTYRILEEYESRIPGMLILECMKLRLKYGAEESSELFPFWYGDEERFASVVSDWNIKNELSTFLTFFAPDDWDKQNRFELYVLALRNLLDDTKKILDNQENLIHIKKRLIIGPCAIFRNNLSDLQTEKTMDDAIEGYPPITAVGGAIHTLSSIKPWTMASGKNVFCVQGY